MVPNLSLRDGGRLAARVIVLCILANSTLSGCAVSPADDRRRWGNVGLRDAGRDDGYDDDDDTPMPAARPRDAGSDARAASPSDAGTTSMLVDAARLDANVELPPSPPAVIPNTRVTAPPGTPTVERARRPSEPDDEEDEPEDDPQGDEPDPDGAGGRTSARAGDGGDAAVPTGASTRERSSRSAVAPRRCRELTDCPASACAMSEAQCCRTDGTCGCTSFPFGFLCR